MEIKRTIPKGAAQTNDFKTKKIFVGGIPTTVTEGVTYLLAFLITSVYDIELLIFNFMSQ